MKKILVIEDDSPVRAGIVGALRRKGYNVLDTGLGADGLGLALTHQPNLILSDINLPGLTGLDVLKALRTRAETAAIPVILMTGETHKVDARTGMDRGADDYLAKPFSMEQMLATIAVRLDRQDGIQHALDVQNQAERISTAEKLRLQTSALEAAANGIVITDRNGRIMWVNRAFTKLTGYTVEEAEGKTPRLLKSGQHSPKFYADMWATISTGNVWQGELVNKRKDGSPYYEEMTITPVCDQAGDIQNFIAIKQDVSKRKQTEQALAHERDLLQALMDNLPDHIYFKDANSRFTRINRAHARHLGLKNPDDAIGRSDADYFPQHQARQKLVEERCLLVTGRPILGLLEKSDTATGCKWVSSTKVPIHAPDGKITGLVGISRDITESQRVEEALRESELLYHSLVEQLPQSVFRLDRAGRITFANSRYCEQRHCQLSDVLGKTDADLYPAELAAKYWADSLRVMESGKVSDTVERHPGADGQETFVQVVKSPLRAGDGQIIGLQVMFWDVTDRKRAELALIASEQRYRDLFENMNEGFAFCEMIYENGQPSDFVYLAVNEMFSTLTGLKAVVGRRVTEVIPGIRESDPDLLGIYGRVSVTGKPERCERFVQGLKMWFDLSVYSTKPGFFVVVFDVITERKRMEESLRQGEEKFRNLFELSRDAIMVVDIASGKFIAGNPATVKMFGVRNENELMTLRPDDLSPERQPDGRLSAEKAKEMMAKAVRKGSHLFEWTQRGLGGEEFSADVLLTRMEQDGKTVLQATVRDITERKRAELERQMMELQLRQAQKLESIGQLAAGIAHEINTPTQYVGDNTRFVKDSFASIGTILQSHEELLAAAKAGAVTPALLARTEGILAAADLDYLRAQIPLALTETLEGVERVSKIVRAMKEFSHPGGKEKAPADLNKAIESTATVARNEWKYVADLKLELEPNLPSVPCFLGEINQAVLNLLVNAAHAIGDVVKRNPGTKGLITVQTRRDGDQVEVRVADTGTGIPEAVRSKIFEPFFTTKDVGKGTGQGLAMIYGSVVHRHGGTATFETETGRGTTFIIRLPLQPKAAPVENQPRPPEIQAA